MNSSLTQDIYSFFPFSSSESPIFARLVGAPCQRGYGSFAGGVLLCSRVSQDWEWCILRSPCVRNQAKSHKTTQFSLFSVAPRVMFPICSSTDSRFPSWFARELALSILLWKLGFCWYHPSQGASALTRPGGMRSRVASVGFFYHPHDHK